MSVLHEILKHCRNDLKQRKSARPLKELKKAISDCPETKNFRSAITRDRACLTGRQVDPTRKNTKIRLIAEIKKASPSEGVIRADFNLADIIAIYNRKTVDAVSVLTEERFFKGSLDNLREARKMTDKPLLRKDFIFDEYQIYESRANGADAVLLIAAVLDKPQLNGLMGLSKELSLECLVEVHNLKELDIALYSGAEIIGINNRDLNTLETRISTTFELMKDIPDDKVVVSESGIHTQADVKALESAKVDAILVGTTLMKAKDIGAKIDKLLGK